MKIFKGFTLGLGCLLSLLVSSGSAQSTAIIHQGEIEFEKRINAYAILNEYYSSDNAKQFASQYKATNPQFGITSYTLLFNDNRSLYTPTSNTADMPKLPLLTRLNIVYSDLVKHISFYKKRVYSEEFLVSDSLRHVRWKITDETKEIAGFICRRANAIIMDSVYVVAFYTDQIAPKSGPESFTGLPGMILGISLPHEHLTWFATRVVNRDVPDSDIKPPTAQKKVTYKEWLDLYLQNPLFQGNPKIGGLNLNHSMF